MVPLNLFQLIGVAGALCVAGLVLRAVRARRLAPGPGLFWVGLWTASAAFIARPDWTVAFASRLGIARGADLVFYCGILASMVGFLWTYVRMRRLESQITRLVRELALAGAAHEEADDRPEKS